jgi:hypothetical protein
MANHGGCFDCGNEDFPTLFSVVATRAMNRKKPDDKQRGSVALRPPCYKTETGKDVSDGK